MFRSDFTRICVECNIRMLGARSTTSSKCFTDWEFLVGKDFHVRNVEVFIADVVAWTTDCCFVELFTTVFHVNTFRRSYTGGGNHNFYGQPNEEHQQQHVYLLLPENIKVFPSNIVKITDDAVNLSYYHQNRLQGFVFS